MTRASALQRTLAEVHRRLGRSLALAREGHARAKHLHQVAGDHYFDGRCSGLAQAQATVEDVWREIVLHAGGNPNEHPLEGITNANER